jgi:hypothetical protein
MNSAMSPMSSITSAMSTLQDTLQSSKTTSSTPLLNNATSSAQGTTPSPFADLSTDAIGQVNQLEDTAHATVNGLLNGSGVDVHTAHGDDRHAESRHGF